MARPETETTFAPLSTVCTKLCKFCWAICTCLRYPKREAQTRKGTQTTKTIQTGNNIVLLFFIVLINAVVVLMAKYLSCIFLFPPAPVVCKAGATQGRLRRKSEEEARSGGTAQAPDDAATTKP